VSTSPNINGRPTVENINATVSVIDRIVVAATGVLGQAFQQNAFQQTSFQANLYRDAFAAGFQQKRAFQRVAATLPPEPPSEISDWIIKLRRSGRR
jgi:hypothetical protein